MLLNLSVYLLHDNIDNSEMPYFYPDTLLKEADGVGGLGQIYRTVQRADSSAQSDDIAALALCLLVCAGSGRLGTVRHFIVLGGLSSPPGAYERIGVLSAIENSHPGWYTEMEEWEVLIF
jgi:hypothetical protein